MTRRLPSVPIDDLRIISVTMDSDYSDVAPGGTSSSVRFDIGNRETRQEGGTRTLGLSLRVSMETTENVSSKKVFSANVRVGCTVHPLADETDDELVNAAVEACVGYARSIIMSLANSSLAGMRLSFPSVRTVDILAAQDHSDDA